jgi:hypothetical protein
MHRQKLVSNLAGIGGGGRVQGRFGFGWGVR